MLTNPNTLGLFDENISEITSVVHDAGGTLYYDGANLNAIMGRTRPGGHGLGHSPLQPAQDLLSPTAAAAGVRADRRLERIEPSCRAPRSFGTRAATEPALSTA